MSSLVLNVVFIFASLWVNCAADCSPEDASPKTGNLSRNEHLLLNTYMEIGIVDSLQCKTDCNVVNMTVHCSKFFDPRPLFNCCKRLQIIQFRGKGYDCEDERWIEFFVEARMRGASLRDEGTTCKQYGADYNGTTYKSYGPDCNGTFIYYFMCMDAKHHCKNGVKECNCHFKMRDGIYVECSNRGMEVHELPQSLPVLTTTLDLNNNQLNDTIKGWLDTVLKDRKLINILNLKGNNLTAIPSLLQTKNKLQVISFEENLIKKLDPVPLESYLKHYEKAVISLFGLHFVCDCNTHLFVDFMKKNLKLFGDYNLYFCWEDKNENETKMIRPWMYENPKCEKNMINQALNSMKNNLDIIFMVILNLFLVAVLLNTQFCLNKILDGDVDTRPWIDYVFEAVKRSYDAVVQYSREIYYKTV